MQRSSINIMKCRGTHNQRIACKELGLNVDKEIRNDKEPMQIKQYKVQKFRYKLKEF